MNLALAKSNIPMNYIRWGSVQMLPLTHAQIETEGSSNYDRHRNFLNAFGDNEEGRQKLKQSADHMIVMLNMVTGPYSCVIYYQNQEFAETYSTVTVAYNMPDIFVHEVGHCLGAMHDRYTSGMDQALDDLTYDYGYCLPCNADCLAAQKGYSTVMAYERSCPPPNRERILYFSNPDVTYQGIPTGDERNNNALTITERKDWTSKYGSNCYNGNPDEDGNMDNQCRLTEWTEWSEWNDCCCVEFENYRTCPLAPHPAGSNIWTYLYRKSKRTKSRSCLNALDEQTDASSCTDDNAVELGEDMIERNGVIYETKWCACN